MNKEFSFFGAPKFIINHTRRENRSEFIKTKRKPLFFSVQVAEAQAEVVSAAEKCCLRVDTLEDTVVSVCFNLFFICSICVSPVSTAVCVLCCVSEVTDRRVSEVSAAGAAGSVGDLGGHAVSSAQ